MILKVFSNPNHLGILWFYRAQVPSMLYQGFWHCHCYSGCGDRAKQTVPNTGMVKILDACMQKFSGPFCDAHLAWGGKKTEDMCSPQSSMLPSSQSAPVPGASLQAAFPWARRAGAVGGVSVGWWMLAPCPCLWEQRSPTSGSATLPRAGSTAQTAREAAEALEQTDRSFSQLLLSASKMPFVLSHLTGID